jgi:hypothetical protein
LAALPDIVIALGLLVGFLVAYGMLYSYSYSLGPVLRGVAWFLNNLKVNVWFISVNVGEWLGKELLKLDRAVMHVLGSFAASMDSVIGAFLHANAQLFEQLARTIEGLSADTLTVLRTIRTETITRLTRGAIAAVNARVRALQAYAHAVDARLRAAQRALTHTLAVVRRSVAVTLPGRIAHVGSRVGRLERSARAQAKRLTRVEKLLSGAAVAALVATALTRLGLNWIRCSNVKRTGRAVCGMDTRLLDTLLLDAATLTVAFNLEEFAEALQAVTEQAADLIHDLAA